MSNTYFVKERVNHDGIQYERGQEIILGVEHAEKLLASGVVSESPVEEAVASEVVAPAPEDTKASLDGGGEASTETGEPSLDGTDRGGNGGTELTSEKKEGGILGRIFGGTKEEDKDSTGNGVVPTGTATDAPVVTYTSSTAPQNDPSVGL